MFATPGCIRLRGFSLLACGQLPVVRDVKCGEALVLACDLRAQLVPQLVGNLEEDFDDGRIELGAGAAQHLLARGIEASCGAVGTVACDGVKRVGDSENTRADRDFDPSQTARITAAVKVFLVSENDCRRLVEEWDLAQNIVAEGAVLAHDSLFFGRESAGLLQDVVRNGHLANIVKKRAASADLDLARRNSHGAGEGGRIDRKSTR